jgi:D-3-phosphoglycerate dehydrogenase / 2-oxoglutarate reductase
VPNVVNIQKGAEASHLLVVRHLDRVGVLAHVLAVLKEEHINVQEMENIVLGGGEAAIAQIAIDKQPSADAIVRIKHNQHVFDASVLSLAR